MYLHAGNGKNIRERDIIGIFDFDIATLTEVGRRYLAYNQRQGLIEVANNSLPKSFILYFSEKEGFYKICFSSIAVGALCRRG